MPKIIKPFDDSSQKDRRRSSTNQSNDTSDVDAYRQGVELTRPQHYAVGVAKIHSGYNEQDGDHETEQLVYGQLSPTLRDDVSFLDFSKFNPLSRF